MKLFWNNFPASGLMKSKRVTYPAVTQPSSGHQVDWLWISVTWILREHQKWRCSCWLLRRLVVVVLTLLVTERDAEQLEVMVVMGLPSCCTLTHIPLPLLSPSRYDFHSDLPSWVRAAVPSGGNLCLHTDTWWPWIDVFLAPYPQRLHYTLLLWV